MTTPTKAAELAEKLEKDAELVEPLVMPHIAQAMREAASFLRASEVWVPDVDDLRDRLVAISIAVAGSDDRAAQSMLREILVLLTAAPHPPAQQAEPAWICWSGGECPVPDGTPVLVRYRNGCEAGPFPANEHLENRFDDAGPAYWKHDGISNDITAYRCAPPPHKAEGAEQ